MYTDTVNYITALVVSDHEVFPYYFFLLSVLEFL